MKTIKLYQCEVCGLKSENEEEVLQCEAQGKKNRFSKDDKVKIFWEGEWVLVRVENITFEENSHAPVYEVENIEPGHHGEGDFTLAYEGSIRSLSHFTE